MELLDYCPHKVQVQYVIVEHNQREYHAPPPPCQGNANLPHLPPAVPPVENTPPPPRPPRRRLGMQRSPDLLLGAAGEKPTDLCAASLSYGAPAISNACIGWTLDPGPWTLNRRLLQFFYSFYCCVHLSTALLLYGDLVLEPSSLICLLSLLSPFNFEPTHCFSASFLLGLLQNLARRR
jgi:hypothetical protein